MRGRKSQTPSLKKSITNGTTSSFRNKSKKAQIQGTNASSNAKKLFRAYNKNFRPKSKSRQKNYNQVNKENIGF